MNRKDPAPTAQDTVISVIDVKQLIREFGVEAFRNAVDLRRQRSDQSRHHQNQWVDQMPFKGDGPLVNPAELALLRMLVQSSPRRRFSVEPAGSVFVADSYGMNDPATRVYVTGISPILDLAAARLLSETLGEGGRMTVLEDRIVRTSSMESLLSLSGDEFHLT